MRNDAMSDRQKQIVTTAMSIIATQGSRRFTVQHLASRIGVTVGAIYRHFESMEEVIEAVVEEVGSLLDADYPAGDLGPIERLDAFFSNRTRTIFANPDVSRVLLSDHLAQAAGPSQAERLEAFKRKSSAFVRDCLGQAESHGRRSKTLSPEAGAVLVIGAILALAHASTRVADSKGLKALSTEVWSKLRSMIAEEPLPGRARKVSISRKRRRDGGSRGSDEAPDAA